MVFDYRSMMPQFSNDGIDKIRNCFLYLRKMAYKKHATPAQISLAWILCKKAISCTNSGNKKGRTSKKKNADAASIILTEQEVKEIDDSLSAMEMSEVLVVQNC